MLKLKLLTWSLALPSLVDPGEGLVLVDPGEGLLSAVILRRNADTKLYSRLASRILWINILAVWPGMLRQSSSKANSFDFEVSAPWSATLPQERIYPALIEFTGQVSIT